MKKNPPRKRKLWLPIVGAALPIVGGTVRLATYWCEHEKVDLSCKWEHLTYFNWGGYFSVTEHDDSDKPGYILYTYRQWCIGPFMARHLVYARPGSH